MEGNMHLMTPKTKCLSPLLTKILPKKQKFKVF